MFVQAPPAMLSCHIHVGVPPAPPVSGVPDIGFGNVLKHTSGLSGAIVFAVIEGSTVTSKTLLNVLHAPEITSLRYDNEADKTGGS